MISKEPVCTERGWAGHYCLAEYCRFHRNTLVRYGTKRIVVSSVGNCRLPNYEGMQEIGLNRLYETMVFWARLEPAGYWEADVCKEISCFPSELPWCILKNHARNDIDNQANEVHERMVAWVKEYILTAEYPSCSNFPDDCTGCVGCKSSSSNKE